MKYLLLAYLLLMALPARAEDIYGTVIDTRDGDTITVIDRKQIPYKVRMAYCDAPELSQPFGQNSRDALAALVSCRRVRIHPVNKDRYGRVVGVIYRDDFPESVNDIMLWTGMAWHYRQYDKAAVSEHHASLEASAQEAHIGVWNGEHEALWIYRREKKKHGQN